jgi:hypothetical protein
MSKDLMFILFVLAIVGTIFVFMPLAGIWSLNTLFSLSIPYTFDTWCAAFIITAVLNGSGLTFRSKK